MATNSNNTRSLLSAVVEKSTLKQEVFQSTLGVFNSFKNECETLVIKNRRQFSKAKYPLLFEFSERGEFEFKLSFGSDTLVFFMHSNVFEFSRDHEVMKSTYIREDKTRSYCGIIHIFNFLADSLRYNRTGDVGYCIGRVFLNRELHYFIEGKRELGLLYNNFPSAELDLTVVRSIIHSAMLYTVNFDLLTPPFDSIKEVTVGEILTTLDAMSIRTGKRLGFRFQADEG